MLVHDLRSPLSVIEGCAGLLQDRNPGLHRDDLKLLGMITRSVQRITQILEDFQTLTSIKDGSIELSPQPTSLGLLAEFHAEEYKAAAAEKNMDISSQCPLDLPPALVDEAQFSRVLSNLLSNAVKYGKEGGSIQVKCGTHEAEPGRLYIEVSDDGPGIPERELPHVFEKFKRGTTSTGTRGNGLGLAIVKALTEMHGGVVQAHSTEGIGTTIRVELPSA